MDTDHDWQPENPNIVSKLLTKFVPRKNTFLICIGQRPGCALIGLISIILPVVDIVQIGEFLFYPKDESEEADGWMKCPNQWYLKTSPVSSYAIFSIWHLVFFHLFFAVVYFLLSFALIVGVTWKLERLIISVLIGAILVYIPSAVVYLLEIITSFKSSTTKVAAWIFFFSPLVWIYFVAVIHGYVHNLQTERLIKEGVLVKSDVFTKWAPTSLATYKK